MRVALLGMVLLLTACGQAMQSGSGPVAFMVEPQTLSPGDSVTLILRNDSPAEVGYNLCSSLLEQNMNGDWRQVPSDRMCTMELRLLPPGEVTRYPLLLEPGIAPGEYRFTTSVDAIGEGVRGPVRTPPFSVAD